MSTPARVSPWRFVPVLYFLQGVPTAMAQQLAVALYKTLLVDNGALGLVSSLVRLPWTLKPLLAPLVETHGTKRRWIVGSQLVVALFIAATAFTVETPWMLWLSAATLGLMALASSLHDIAADGFYLQALAPTQQAAFVGIRSAAFRVAMVAVGGGLVWLAGDLGESMSTPVAWRWTILLGAAAYAMAVLLNAWLLPHLSDDRPRPAGEGATAFATILGAYLRQPRLPSLLAFIAFYRVGESMLSTMATPFLIDGVEKGGLGLSVKDAGFIQGTVGILALTAGGMLGGWVLGRWGFQRVIWPLVITMHAPNLLYVWASMVHAGVVAVGCITAVEQFAYGFGFSAFLVALMERCRGSAFPTSSYAISSGLMALSALAAGAASGFLVDALGYTGFFVVVCLSAIPGMLVVLAWRPVAPE